MIVTHNTTINLTCVTSDVRAPGWFANKEFVSVTGDRYRATTSNGVYKTATLTINGNLTCETVNVYCEVYSTTEQRFVHMHNTTLRFQGWLQLLFGMGFFINATTLKTLTFTGRLPSPESVHIKEHFNSSTIGWNPPYSAINNASNVINVDPHITQYTVYITDNYTGNTTVKKDVTETQFRPNIQQDNDLCPMYQVSAWNAGGEGELSEPVQESTPRGN